MGLNTKISRIIWECFLITILKILKKSLLTVETSLKVNTNTYLPMPPQIIIVNKMNLTILPSITKKSYKPLETCMKKA